MAGTETYAPEVIPRDCEVGTRPSCGDNPDIGLGAVVRPCMSSYSISHEGDSRFPGFVILLGQFSVATFLVLAASSMENLRDSSLSNLNKAFRDLP